MIRRFVCSSHLVPVVAAASRVRPVGHLVALLLQRLLLQYFDLVVAVSQVRFELLDSCLEIAKLAHCVEVAVT